MERRVIVWVLATTLCMLLYLKLQPAPKPDENLGGPGKGANAEAIAAKEPAPPLQLEPQRWWTLGSMDPQDGFNILVTVTNRGGGIERVELTEREKDGTFRYRRTDIESGYLGYLSAVVPQEGSGAEVRVVGRGTPAALAKGAGGLVGLLPGDVITSVNDDPVEGPDSLARLLEKTLPGAEVEIAVSRPEPQKENVPAAEQGDNQPKDAADAEPKDKDADEPAVGPAPVVPRQALRFTAKLTEHPLDLLRLSSTGGEDEIVTNVSRLSCLMTLSQVGKLSIPVGEQELPGVPSQYDSIWASRATDGKNAVATEIEFRLPLTVPLKTSVEVELVRKYVLRPATDEKSDGYVIDLEQELINHSPEPLSLAARLNGPNGMTLEGWWYLTKITPNWWIGAGARDVISSSLAEGHRLFETEAIRKHHVNNTEDRELPIVASSEDEKNRSLRYIAMDGQYFSAGYLPEEDAGPTMLIERASGYMLANVEKTEKSKYRALNCSFLVDGVPQEAAAEGGSTSQKLRFFVGPKRPELLAKVRMEEAIEYGWFPWVARPLSGVLHLFNWLVGNYGIAIIMLTVMVRACMFPLGRRAAIHAQRMQELAPELKKINEKYKEDLQKRMEAQRELQRRVGFNPLSGCLPLFIQIPIFIGLYRCLSVDIELRQATLNSAMTWCSNLAAPDQLFEWQNWMPEFLAGRGSGWLGPYFNILPVVVVGLFLLQQKMFMPPATDEQTLMTQKIMNFMTVIMGVFFFKVPAGLCIYFITSSLWSIAERKLVKKTIPQGTNVLATAGAPAPVASRTVADNPRKKRKKLPRR